MYTVYTWPLYIANCTVATHYTLLLYCILFAQAVLSILRIGVVRSKWARLLGHAVVQSWIFYFSPFTLVLCVSEKS